MEEGIAGYRIGRNLGTGAFGRVFYAIHSATRSEVALKIATEPRHIQFLRNESEVYKKVSGEVGFATLDACDFRADRSYLSMGLLGRNLGDVFHSLDKKLSLKTVLMIADQVLLRLEYLHRKGFVHCDVKPENLLVGLGSSSNQVYLVDFGLSKRYEERDSGETAQLKSVVRFEGTTRFASIAAHRGLEMRPKDDLESLGYTLVYFMKGKLPWTGMGGSKNEQKREFTYVMKNSVSTLDLCEELPVEFRQFFDDLRGLNPWERPEYEKYRNRFRELFIRSEMVYDYRYDWVEKQAQSAFVFPVRAASTQPWTRHQEVVNVTGARLKMQERATMAPVVNTGARKLASVCTEQNMASLASLRKKRSGDSS